MFAADGTLLGEFAREYRELTPFERIPKRLVDAFLAVEDHDFWKHGGLYYKGIARAVWANVTEGEFAQGGSTITQQLAKQFLTDEKSIWRKAIEAVLARRLEATYSKRAILSLYLNHIYLGARAWGVTAAAHRYFQKELSELTLAEAALIAGLAKAPSAYSPLRAPELALKRRDVVLDKMQRHGFGPAPPTWPRPGPSRWRSTAVPGRVPQPHAVLRPARAGLRRRQARRGGAAGRRPHHRDRGRAGVRGRGVRQRRLRHPPPGQAAGLARPGVARRRGRQGHRDRAPARLYGAGHAAGPGKRYLAVVDKVDGNGAQVHHRRSPLKLPLRNMKWASPGSRATPTTT
jgi:penicillin-binding protein 1A